MLKELNTKEYRLPLKEFQEKFGIPSKITNVTYYGGKCDRDEETKEEFISITVEVD